MRLLFVGIWTAATLQLACDAASEPSETTTKASAKTQPAALDEDEDEDEEEAAGPDDEAPSKAALPLAKRFEGAASDGVKSTHLKVGIPAGWRANEWGDVELGKKEGYAAAYNLPVWPPAPSHVALRTKSIGCKDVELPEATPGKLGKGDVEAYFWEAKGTCGGDPNGKPGKPSTLWIAATKGREVLIVYLNDDAVEARANDVADIIKPFGGA